MPKYRVVLRETVVTDKVAIVHAGNPQQAGSQAMLMHIIAPDWKDADTPLSVTAHNSANTIVSVREVKDEVKVADGKAE